MQEQPDPNDLALIVPGAEALVEEDVAPVVDTTELPEELKATGIRGWLFGRISTKIYLPFFAVILLVAVGGFLLVSSLLSQSLNQRFENQLQDAGKAVNDTILKIEGSQQELIRLMANVQGVDVALKNKDVTTLQKLLVPLQANSDFTYVDILDLQGNEVLALRPNADNSATMLDPAAGQWDVSKNSIANNSDKFGNKWTQLVNTSYGAMIYTGGAILDDNNQPVGAVLVGMPFQDLFQEVSKNVGAFVTIYRTDGTVFGTSLPVSPSDQKLDLDQSVLNSVLSDQAAAAGSQRPERALKVAGQGYKELIGGLVVRDKIGAALGVSVSTAPIEQAQRQTAILLTIALAVLAAGVYFFARLTARRIANPIQKLVKACQMVARGEFEEKVQIGAQDETGVLAHTFNQMMDGLKERDRIRDTFSRYMTSQVTDAILKGEVKLGGEMREITMLMSDIRSFTTLSEGMHPEDLVAFLNRYFGAMIDCVVAHDGVINRFMGDAILAVYGAPVRDPDHPSQAVLTALDMRERLVQFNDELIAEGKQPIRIGIGVNTGEAVTGNIGSEVRMEYTVIGETVSSAERTEDLTKEYKTDILISETTAERLDGRFILGEPHDVMTGGRASHIFPVIGQRSGSAELWHDHGPMMLSEAPIRAQALADAAFEAHAEGRLELGGHHAAQDLVTEAMEFHEASRQGAQAMADEMIRQMAADAAAALAEAANKPNGHTAEPPAAPRNGSSIGVTKKKAGAAKPAAAHEPPSAAAHEAKSTVPAEAHAEPEPEAKGRAPRAAAKPRSPSSAKAKASSGAVSREPNQAPRAKPRPKSPPQPPSMAAKPRRPS